MVILDFCALGGNNPQILPSKRRKEHLCDFYMGVPYPVGLFAFGVAKDYAVARF